MNLKRLVTALSWIFLGFGAIMSLINAYNGHGLKTNKTLHPYIWAQLNGEDSPNDVPTVPGGDGTGDGGTTGGGTATGGNTGGGDETSVPSGSEGMNYEKDHKLTTQHVTLNATSDQNGKIRTLGLDIDNLRELTEYTITVDVNECIAWNGYYCDIQKEKSYLCSIVMVGSK